MPVNAETQQQAHQDIFDLTGMTALVTGASQGLGRNFTRVLAARGAAVALAARQTAKLEALQREIEASGGRAVAIEMDVVDAASRVAGLDRAERALGPIDVLINNAGVARDRPALEQSEADWDLVLDSNLKAPFLLATEVARRLAAARREGSIINIASVLGLGVTGNLAPYSASKAGLIHLTRALAREWAPKGIRVNAIAPGYIATEINQEFFATPGGERLIRRIPQRRLGAESDLDGAIVLLASRASRYMTGSVVTVDGGYLLA